MPSPQDDTPPAPHDPCPQATRLLAQDRLQEAADALQAALAQRPDNVPLLKALAGCLVRQRRLVAALETYDRLIGLGAADAAVWLETGQALTEVREYAQASDALARSLQMAPSHEARYAMGRAVFALGDVQAACAHFRTVAVATDAIQAWSSLAKIIPGDPSATHAVIRESRQAFAKWLRRHAGLPSRVRPGPYRGHDRLRIGYLSAFFDRANYMKPVWGLVNHHDRRRFAIHLFSDTSITAGWEGYQRHASDQLHAIAGLDNAQLADLMREVEIDILIDLNAYSSADRLALFLDPPAPVVAAWFNMYATSGLGGFDLIIGDREVVRPEEEAAYTERVVCLPGSYLTFEVGHRAPPVQPPPCRRNGHFTFGSLVSQYKLTPVVLDAWAEILKQVDASRLVLGNRALQSTCNQDYLAARFADRGIARERLTFLPPADHYAFLDYYSQIDLALDAFPYNGGTTTTEAIWQGVPVLAIDGDRWAARTSQTLLRRTHLGEFVAPSRQRYIQTAVDMARDPRAPARLGDLRKTMRDRLLASPVCDTAALARGMEAIFQQAVAGQW